MDSLYSQYKVCAACGFEDCREIAEEIAAFEQRRAWDDVCSKCGSAERDNGGVQLPILNEKLMAIWSQDLALSFFQQDEEISLADESLLPLLLQYLDCDATLVAKKSIILAIVVRCSSAFDGCLFLVS